MKKLFGIVGLCAVLGTAVGAESDGVELLYQRALHLETAKADYDGAIPIYATILSQHAQNAAIAAKALFRQGVCYEKTGKLDLARECARKLTGEFQAIAKADPSIAEWTKRIAKLGDGNLGGRDLSEIKLPDQPNETQVKTYIKSIVESARGRRSWASNDPQVEMLKKVGPENISLLIAAQSPRAVDFSIHLIYAVRALADERCKKVILDNLPTCEWLAEVIVEHGWEQDAREILLRGLRSRPVLPSEPWIVTPDWIVAVARLRDPATYPLLRAYFVGGSNEYHTYEAIKDLPIGDLAGAVNEAWQNSRRKHTPGKDPSAGYMALVAAEYGHLDALEFLALQWADLPENDEWFANQVRRVFAKITDFTGTGTEAPAWFKTHRERLKFDPATKKFVTGKSDVPSASAGEVK